MEKNEKTTINEEGYQYTVGTVETDFTDGFVREKDVHRVVGIKDVGKVHLGKQKHVSFTTDDPKIVRIAALFFLLFFLAIGYIGYSISEESIILYFSAILGIVSFVSINIDVTRRQKKRKNQDK